MEEEEWLRIGVAGVLAREYAAEGREFLESLAGMLASALPGQAEVIRQGRLFGRRGPIREVRVELGDFRYSLHDSGSGPLATRRTLVKRGIVLRTEELPVETWLEELGNHLEERARRSREAAEALRRFVG